MIALQIGIIIFLILILAIVYQDEYKKKRLERKTARLNRFWNSAEDRRKSLRIDSEIDVLYEISSEKQESIKRNSTSKNISLGGINLALDEKLFPDTILEMQLNIPTSNRPIFAQGKVVWVKEIPEKFIKQKGERFFATGIKFVQMAVSDQNTLSGFINRNAKTVSKYS